MITDEQAANELQKICENNIGDNEWLHVDADEYITKLLIELWYTKTADKYDEMWQDFWYA